MQVSIRWLVRDDLQAVLAIERKSFEFPMTEADYIQLLRQRNVIGMVAEYDGRIVGYMVYELHRNRIALLSLAVAPQWCGKGVGRSMLDNLKGKCFPHRRIVTHVRETNLSAQMFFKACGLLAKRVERNYWMFETHDGAQRREDAYVFEWQVQQEAAVCN